jgi:hypothetical protein
MTAAYQLDSTRAAAFASDLLRRAVADPRTATLATPELQSLIDLWAARSRARRGWDCAPAPAHRCSWSRS